MMVWAWNDSADGMYVCGSVGEWVGDAIASADGCVGVVAAAFAYVGAGEVAADSALAELGGLEQTDQSFTKLFTYVMTSACLDGWWSMSYREYVERLRYVPMMVAVKFASVVVWPMCMNTRMPVMVWVVETCVGNLRDFWDGR